jgi:hypothetical protein
MCDLAPTDSVVNAIECVPSAAAAESERAKKTARASATGRTG